MDDVQNKDEEGTSYMSGEFNFFQHDLLKLSSTNGRMKVLSYAVDLTLTPQYPDTIETTIHMQNYIIQLKQ